MKTKSILLGLLVASSHCYAQNNEEILLYSNDFNTGNAISNTSTCSPNIKHNDVNRLFSGTGNGLYTNVLFRQNFTVEVADNIDPPGNIFDPQNKGGKYSITMQTDNNQNDLVWITFSAKDLNPYNYLNFNLDISPTDILTDTRCGLSGTVTTPIVVVSAYLHSSLSISLSNVLSRDTLIGLPPLETYVKRKYDTYNWKNVTANLPIDQLTTDDGYVTMEIDVIQGSYTAIDNFYITSSMLALPINLKNFTGYHIGNKHVIEWNVDAASDFDRFELEVADANHSNDFKYLSTILFNADQHKYSFENDGNTSKLYRLKMIDLDGTFHYSPIVRLNSTFNHNVKVSPNPAKDYLQIDVNYPINVKLYDLYGNQKMVFNMNNEANKVDISRLNSGVYVLHIFDEYGAHTGITKFVKE